MDKNRFLRFFRKNKNLVPKIKYFFIILGITIFILFLFEFFIFLFQQTIHADQFEDYHPFFVYSHDYRKTKNHCDQETEKPLLIHLYGSSTMWGLDVEYENTIPSKLSETLCAKNIYVKVNNYGQLGQTNTQLMTRFIFNLKDGNIPDIVIFYDGANERLQYFNANPYHNPTKLFLGQYFSTRRFLGRTRSVVEEVFGLNPILYEDLRSIFNLNGYFEAKEKNNSNFRFEYHANNYVNNTKLISNLQDVYDFKSFLYLQPLLSTKRYHSEEEIIIYDDLGNMPDEHDLYEQMKLLLEFNPQIIPIYDIFDNYTETIYIDDCHKLPVGNEIVAQRMAEDIIYYLQK